MKTQYELGIELMAGALTKMREANMKAVDKEKYLAFRASYLGMQSMLELMSGKSSAQITDDVSSHIHEAA
jgi:hypothetical protein